jgi:hypothetical protein
MRGVVGFGLIRAEEFMRSEGVRNFSEGLTTEREEYGGWTFRAEKFARGVKSTEWEALRRCKGRITTPSPFSYPGRPLSSCRPRRRSHGPAPRAVAGLRRRCERRIRRQFQEREVGRRRGTK